MLEIIFQSLGGVGQNIQVAWEAFSKVWYVVIPATFYSFFMYLWLYHQSGKYWSTLDWILLEIIPPKDLEKSPKPMEALFAGMAGVEKSFTPIEEFVQGAFPDSFSLELVSIGGDVHFFIRTMKKYRNLVEAHLYAQYPTIEIHQVDDYVDQIPKVTPNTKWDLWGTDFNFTKHEAYPIRTYNFFEEDITGKMIDPLAGLIEVMGKLPPNQQIWLQFVISPTPPAWTNKEGRKAVDKIKGIDSTEEGFFEGLWLDFWDVVKNLWPALSGEQEFRKKDKKKDDQPIEFKLTPGEKEVLRALEDNLGKISYYTKMRFIYIGRKENFDKTFVSAFIGGIKQFNDDNLNGVKPEAESKTFANFIFTKPRLRYRQRKILKRYRTRSMMGEKIVLSTSELATFFHMPDMQVVAPNLQRIEAKTGGAPVNLPIE